MKITIKVAAYNVLICASIAGAAALITSVWGPGAGLMAVGTVACAASLGKVLWP